MVWDLNTFKNSDLRTSATYRHQRIGEAILVGRCELPADRRIVFPLKSFYDQCTVDIFNPLLQDEEGEENFPDDEETRCARAPQTFPEAEAIEPPVGEPEVDDRNGDIEGEPDRVSVSEAEPALVDGITGWYSVMQPVDDEAWKESLNPGDKVLDKLRPGCDPRVSSILTVPESEGYVVRGVSLMKRGDVPLTAISSRHYLPSQATSRRTAVKLEGLSAGLLH